jgi:histidyl-tRNA synthetase
MTTVQAPRGTYDILPDTAPLWNRLENLLRQTATRFGYREIRTPLLEHTELFERGVGETTDIVSKEMYSFEKEERSLTLRPEGTASCVRALLEHGLYSGALPVKWFYLGPMFRYDKPQAGRYRQFHQLGIEAFGSNSPYLDAEVILLLVEMIRALGIADYELHLNSLGCPECRKAYRAALVDYFTPQKAEFCPDCQVRLLKNPLRLLDCKQDKCQALSAAAPVMRSYLCPDCAEHYAAVQSALRAYGVNYREDDRLVRGLDYYTHTAFEIHLPGIGAQSAIGGGGRYNGLVAECGGPELPGIGFAVGLERLLLAAGWEAPELKLDAFVIAARPDYAPSAMELAQELRRAGFSADVDYMSRSLKAQMKYADKIGARYALILGEDELNRGTVTVKDMASSQQTEASRADIAGELTLMLKKDGEETVL